MLVSHTHQHMQEKTTCLIMFAQQIHVGLKIGQTKTEVMMLNVPSPSPVKVNGADLPTTEEFTYLGSTVRYDGGAESDIRNCLNKARNTFRMLNNMWKSSQYSTKTKLKLYQSFVLSTLLYGSEYWRMTESDLNKLSTVHNKNLKYKNPANILARDHLQPASSQLLQPRQHGHHHVKMMEMDRTCDEKRARQHLPHSGVCLVKLLKMF